MFIASAEGAEAEFMYQYVSMAPPSVRSTLGIDTARMGGGVVLSVRNDVTGYWSKALGFGFDEPVTHDLIASVVEYYRTRATPGAVIQIAPAMLPRDWETIRGAFNIRPDSHWVKLACRVEDFRPGHTWLRVGPIGPSTADVGVGDLAWIWDARGGAGGHDGSQPGESEFSTVRGVGRRRDGGRRKPFRPR